MSDWLHHIALKAKARTGFGSALAGWCILAAVAVIFAIVFLSVTAFIALANRFDGVAAGLILGGASLLLAGVAALAAWLTRSRNRERAERELASRTRADWFDPAMLSVALQIGRTLGWRRIVTLAAAGVFAVGVGREWSSRGGKPKDPAGE